MRGNMRDIAASLKDLATTGALTLNDARQMLGLAYVDGGEQPLTPAASASTAPSPANPPTGDIE